MIHPMQYELERAYQTTCEWNAARQHQIKQAENYLPANSRLRPSMFAIAFKLRSRLMPALRASAAELGRGRVGLVAARSFRRA